jgi:hypothetical protein
MKWLILIGILLFVGWLIYFRYRKQIKAVMQVVRVLRAIQKGEMPTTLSAGNQTPKPIQKVETKTKNLVRCETCGKWLAPESAIHFGNSKLRYCSTKCLERVAVRN